MSHSIKVSKEVYKDLRELQGPRETFSDTVENLITLRHLLEKALPLIRGSAEFQKWQQEKSELDKAAHG